VSYLQEVVISPCVFLQGPQVIACCLFLGDNADIPSSLTLWRIPL
jgi:hypothetical protein